MPDDDAPVETSRALEGIRVLDCSTGIAGPLAAMLFADFGADVVKVESPEGDPYRSSPGFAVWNRGKRSIVADLSTSRGARTVEELLDGADVCVANSVLDALAGTVLDPASARERHDQLIYLHVPPYLGTLPWAPGPNGGESDSLLAAATGVALRQASFDGGPIDSIYPHLVIVQGMWAAASAVAALFERERSGIGQTVTVGGVHGVMVAGAGALTFDAAAPRPPRGLGGPGGSVPFYRTYQCEDGEWLFLAALTPRFTEAAFRALGISSLMHDERLGGRGRAGMLQPENLGWVIEKIAEVFRTRPRSAWLVKLAEVGCPVGPVNHREDWLDHSQIRSIGMRIEVDDPERGRVTMPGIPLNLTATPARVRSCAPTLGDTDLEWQSIGRDRPKATGAAPASDDTLGPLEGIRVLDLGAIIAGPLTASLLAELGADVIKVEPLTGDSFRGPGFNAYNKGQRSIALDLRNPLGHRAFLRLVESADLVIDNYRPGVLDRLEIGYERLREVNPRIVTLSITGFGEGGPLSDGAGFDPVLQAMSGMMSAQGGDSDPVFFTVPVNDVAASAISAFGACLALFSRGRRGVGQRVWTSLAAMSALVQAEHLVRFEHRPPAPVGGRDHLGSSALDRYYRAADGWLRIHIPREEESDVREWLIRSGLVDEVPAEVTDIEKQLNVSFEPLTRSEAVARLTRAGIPAAPARRVTELATDKEILENGVLHPDPRTDREGWMTAGRHARFSRTERGETLVSPRLGEHTAEVLASAGVTPTEVQELLDAGAAIQDESL